MILDPVYMEPKGSKGECVSILTIKIAQILCLGVGDYLSRGTHKN